MSMKSKAKCEVCAGGPDVVSTLQQENAALTEVREEHSRIKAALFRAGYQKGTCLERVVTVICQYESLSKRVGFAAQAARGPFGRK